MKERVTVQLVDTDEAGRHASAPGFSRRELLRRALVAGGAVAVGGVVISGLPERGRAGGGGGGGGADSDTAILNFALTLEYLEAEFYTRAEAGGALSGEPLQFAQVVGGHERAHVDFLLAALGSAAVAKPTFDFMGTTEDQTQFLATAVVLEDTGVAAYNGQGTNLTRKTLPAAASIVSVEARHAAWVRDIVGQTPAPMAFDQAQTREQILTAVGQTGFITGS